MSYQSRYTAQPTRHVKMLAAQMDGGRRSVPVIRERIAQLQRMVAQAEAEAANYKLVRDFQNASLLLAPVPGYLIELRTLAWVLGE